MWVCTFQSLISVFGGVSPQKRRARAAFYFNNKRVRFIIVHTQYRYYTYMRDIIIMYGYLLFTKTSDVELTRAV